MAQLPAGQAARILVVDDLDANRTILTRLLQKDGHLVDSVATGDDALRFVAEHLPDLILLDVLMPGTDGFEVCRQLKARPSTRLIPVVMITALQDSTDKIRGIEAGAEDFLSKPFNVYELRARVRSLLRIKRYTDDLDTAEAVIVSLALTIEARDHYTDGHCQRLASYASRLGTIARARRRGSRRARAGRVPPRHRESRHPRCHPAQARPPHAGRVRGHEAALVIGDRLCGELRALGRVRPIVRHHHERLDGSGYPDGLEGDDISLLAQIIGLVDTFDALTTARPYKPAFGRACYDELRKETRRGWRRRDLVDAFVSLVRGDRGTV